MQALTLKLYYAAIYVVLSIYSVICAISHSEGNEVSALVQFYAWQAYLLETRLVARRNFSSLLSCTLGGAI